MPSGRQGSLGIGAETTFGTGVAPAIFVTATESLKETRGRLRQSFVFGSRAMQAADPGRLAIAGSIQDVQARPKNIGEFLRAALGAPATTGTAAPYSHLFKPTATEFASVAALPPYSIQVKRKSDLIQRYTGGQLSKLTLKQPKDDVLSLDTDWLAQDVASATDVTQVLETGTRFRYKHLAVQRDSADFDYVEDLTITLDNGLETEEVFNQEDTISAVGFGANSSIQVQMTITFRDINTYTDFATNAAKAWDFLWTIDTGTTLDIAIPRLNIGDWGAPISGPGRMTITVQGQAEYDATAGDGLEITLTNDVVSYPQS